MFKSVVWDFGGKFLNQIVSFLVSVALARILSPREFGIVAIALVFVGFSTLFLDLGFRNALVFKQDISSKTYSTVFIINVVVALLLGMIFWLAAPSIASFYREPVLKGVVRAITAMFVFSAATLVPNAINSKDLKFKPLAIITVLASVISGGVAVWMAKTGWGLWSIIARYLISSAIVCLFNWLICSWRFLLFFDLPSVKYIWEYSSRFFITTFMEVLFLRFDVLIIGRIFTPTLVGYYNRAQSLDNITRELTSGTVYSVFFPYFTKIQNQRERVIEVYKSCLHVVSMALLLVSALFFMNAAEIFTIVFTSKWLPSASLYKILTIIGFLFTVNVLMNVLLCGIGKVKEYLHVELWKKSLVLFVYCVGFFGDLQLFLNLLLGSYVVGLFLNMVYVRRAIGITIGMQTAILARYVLPCVFAILLTDFLVSSMSVNLWTKIGIRTVSFSFLFLLSNIFLKNEAIHFFKNKGKEYFLLVTSKIGYGEKA